ncbi:hypothetical protein CEXT_340691 [Caerostris extrusa]|uniref:Uncharacterized protein n=1 Tax=Caerostris extrusa TaxID=172846 RepID=A0AAV4TBQ0_CAEEX|nr:hypothetical protein CEXT_340691 [Caerostris extrusa]
MNFKKCVTASYHRDCEARKAIYPRTKAKINSDQERLPRMENMYTYIYSPTPSTLPSYTEPALRGTNLFWVQNVLRKEARHVMGDSVLVRNTRNVVFFFSFRRRNLSSFAKGLLVLVRMSYVRVNEGSEIHGFVTPCGRD